LQLPYSVDRLTGDSVYNLTLGRSYIETMIDEFGGSYPLAIAAYNAGPGRVRQCCANLAIRAAATSAWSTGSR